MQISGFYYNKKLLNVMKRGTDMQVFVFHYNKKLSDIRRWGLDNTSRIAKYAYILTFTLYIIDNATRILAPYINISAIYPNIPNWTMDNGLITNLLNAVDNSINNTKI